jgi:hypothetical protein
LAYQRLIDVRNKVHELKGVDTDLRRKSSRFATRLGITFAVLGWVFLGINLLLNYVPRIENARWSTVAAVLSDCFLRFSSSFSSRVSAVPGRHHRNSLR